MSAMATSLYFSLSALCSSLIHKTYQNTDNSDATELS